MSPRTMNCERAFAHAALEAGVGVVTSYPGSPGSGTVEALLALTGPEDLHVEWSTNEKVALEIAIGASLAGRRSLVCVKSVGMNVLVDPLMVVNLTGVHAGLVILLGDDPGAYGSQNDQDTRPLASFAEVPLLEPATPAEARSMTLEAFDLSERVKTLVVIRETRSLSQATGSVPVEERFSRRPSLPMLRRPLRWVTYPANAVAFHRDLHARVDGLRRWSNDSPFNRSGGQGRKGVITAGFAHRKLLDLAGLDPDGLRWLKLGTLYPLPDRVIAKFLASCDEALVLEENEPFVEREIRAIAHENALRVRVLGKLTQHVPREGELFRWQIQRALERWIEGFVPARTFTRATEADERPQREDHCAGCPYPQIIAALREVAHESGRNPVLVGDPGCLVKAAKLLDAKYAIGSALAVAQGLALGPIPERAVAVFGDSSFFHTGVPALMNAVCQRARILMVVLDNSATVTSGFQPNPGTGLSARGAEAPRLSIEGIAAACGVETVQTIEAEDDERALREVFRDGVTADDLRLIVVRKPCLEADDSATSHVS